MDWENLFLTVMAVLALAFAAYNGTGVIQHRQDMAYTTGTVVSLWMPVAETMKKNNSKWAMVSYKVDGKTYSSKKRIQVPMYCQIGSVVKICYNREKPEELYAFSVKRAVLSFAVTVICVIAVIWRSIY